MLSIGWWFNESVKSVLQFVSNLNVDLDLRWVFGVGFHWRWFWGLWVVGCRGEKSAKRHFFYNGRHKSLFIDSSGRKSSMEEIPTEEIPV